MAIINTVGNSLKGQTGTGMFAGNLSPTFTTPTLGVASATSINFGGSTLSTYVNETSFTPTFTCASNLDLSVSYTSQLGYYSQIGNILFYSITLNVTPTFTLSSGQILITGLPQTPSQSYGDNVGIGFITSNITFPSSTTQFYTTTLGLSNAIGLASFGSGVNNAAITMSQLTSGTAFAFNIGGWYFI